MNPLISVDLCLTAMPARLSEDLKQFIVTWYFEEGLTYWEIKDRAQCFFGLRLSSESSQRLCATMKISARLSILSVNALVVHPALRTETWNAPQTFLPSWCQSCSISWRNSAWATASFSLKYLTYNCSILLSSCMVCWYVLIWKHVQKVAMERNESSEHL